MAWKKLPKKIFGFLTWRKTLAVATTMAAPTIYVITAFMFRLTAKS